ncbi:MAG: hypothetical protein V9E84_06995, partial [Trichococcus flocculiformis]
SDESPDSTLSLSGYLKGIESKGSSTAKNDSQYKECFRHSILFNQRSGQSVPSSNGESPNPSSTIPITRPFFSGNHLVTTAQRCPVSYPDTRATDYTVGNSQHLNIRGKR